MDKGFTQTELLSLLKLGTRKNGKSDPDTTLQNELLGKILSQYRDIVGSILADHTQPRRIQKDTLIITSEHSAYGQEILLHKKAILRKIDQITGVSLKNLHIQTGRIEWKNQKTGDIMSPDGKVTPDGEKNTPHPQAKELRALSEALKKL